jgi:hypothetical protein
MYVCMYEYFGRDVRLLGDQFTCVYVCMYICMYVCIHGARNVVVGVLKLRLSKSCAAARGPVHLCVYVCMYEYFGRDVRLLADKFTCVYMYVCMYVCIFRKRCAAASGQVHLCVYACMHVRMYICIYIYIHHINLHIYVCVCICIYIYIYIHKLTGFLPRYAYT